MNFAHPWLLLLAIPVLGFLLWSGRVSRHPMGSRRRRLLLALRGSGAVLLLLALAAPALRFRVDRQAVVLVLDHSRSQGLGGIRRVHEAAEALTGSQSPFTARERVIAGSRPRRATDSEVSLGAEDLEAEWAEYGDGSDLAAAVDLALGMFPAGVGRHVVLVTDGHETSGDLLAAAGRAALTGARVHAVAVAGDKQADVRVESFEATPARLSEGATVELHAVVAATTQGSGKLRLFENGLEVESRPFAIEAGGKLDAVFRRSPGRRDAYRYRLVVEDFTGPDELPANNERLALVDVLGKPLLLYVEGESGVPAPLREAMEPEGIHLEMRAARDFPRSASELAPYDGVVFSDVAAYDLPEGALEAIREYVREFGGGLVMTGGGRTFGLGGFHRTALEEMLPVRLQPPDDEELQSAALALVMDRSGSMAGQKIEMCKSAAIATAELLTGKDFVGVYAFDSQAREVLPMTRVTDMASIRARIATLSAGGGTNIRPGIESARAALNRVSARRKHMIVLTDGNTSGQDYEELARQCRLERITISTVAVGENAAAELLQVIADAGGGQAYRTLDPETITRIFTQDAMVHVGRLIREEPFVPVEQEAHPMIREWDRTPPPPLLGYVRTFPRRSGQILLAAESGDPLLAHGRFGLGKVSVFASDAKGTWSALWVQRWEGFGQFWSQVLRETARPPQGRTMDLRLTGRGPERGIAVDLLQDAGTFRQGARVEAEVFHTPPEGMAGTLRPLSEMVLTQAGPGRYQGSFLTGTPGIYLVRARHGGEVLSAGVAEHPSVEAADGTANVELLRRAAERSGGQLLEPGQEFRVPEAEAWRFLELRPWLILAFLAVFLADLVVRRWENVLGMWGG